MPRKTYIRPERDFSPRAELCAVCDCEMSAVECCRIYARRYINAAGRPVGLLDCPFNPSIEVVDVDTSTMSDMPFRTRRVAARRLEEEWADRTRYFDELMKRARARGEMLPV